MQDGEERPPLVDIVFALAILGFAGAIWWGTAGLPPPRYEPIGSAALPRGLAAVMALLALIIGIRAVLRQRASKAGGDTLALPFRPRPLLAIGVFVVLALYVLVMDLRLAGFVPASILAFFVIGGMLGGFAPRRLPWLIGFVVLLVFAIHLVFTRFFYIDLP